MEQVLILLVMLAGVTHAFFTPAETTCNATQNTSLCSATLGGSVYIQVMTNTSGHQLHCKKQLPSGPINVFNLKKDKVTIQEAFRNSTEFFISNGTFKITSVAKTDSGQYTVTVHGPNGIHVKTINVKLDVQESNLPILILVGSALAVLILIVIVVMVLRWCCCDNKKVGRHKKSGKPPPQSALYNCSDFAV